MTYLFKSFCITSALCLFTIVEIYAIKWAIAADSPWPFLSGIFLHTWAALFGLLIVVDKLPNKSN